MFNSWLPFLQLTIKNEEDSSFHIRTFIYRVKTPNGNYIIHVEEYINNFYAIKFYPARFKRHPDKFNIIVKNGALQVVIGTCLRILLKFFLTNSVASFGFIATPTIVDDFIEAKSNNQRYRIYKQVMQNFFGDRTFAHFADIKTSAYLMINKSCNNVNDLVYEMQQKFSDMYPEIFDLQFTQV